MTADRIKPFFLLFTALLSAVSLFAAGKQDDAEENLQNNEWVLCITAFDSALLPPSQRVAGDVITRILIEKLSTINYRVRISPEYAYYEGIARRQLINTTARALAQKQEERSLYLYRGEAGWRYRRNLQRVDQEIAKLSEELAQLEGERPLINNEPVFRLSQSNTDGNWPAVPAPGAERRFCQSQNADAFLTGEIREFHGRYYVRLQLYTLYNNGWAFEDDTIFSMEDINGAVDEISTRLIAVISGTAPAVVAVEVDPPDANILINRNYAGRGTVPEREQPPGNIIVEAAAAGYNPQTIETELLPGELTSIKIGLGPLLYADVHIAALEKTGVSVYHGALYVGEAPLTLRLPIDQLNYISLETPDGEMAKAAFTSPDMPDEISEVALRLSVPPPGERRVNKARSRYYWAWGTTWITGVTWWVTSGIYSSQIQAPIDNYDPDFIASARAMQYVSIGSLVLFGASLAYTLFEEYRYLRTSSEKATPIVKTEKPKE